jgi:hypothetical protein
MHVSVSVSFVGEGEARLGEARRAHLGVHVDTPAETATPFPVAVILSLEVGAAASVEGVRGLT